MKHLLHRAPRYLFFTGKGGVGKTSMSCIAAAYLAKEGKKVLLISTDPASNLDEVLETPLGAHPKSIKGIEGLYAMNIDPEEAARDYRERIVGPYREALPESAVRSIEEQLSGACTVEIASFNEFSRIIGDDAIAGEYDHIILDTAPTGHTLRLLNLPAAWNDFIADNKTGSSCLGPLSGLADQRKMYQTVRDRLADPAYTLLVLVACGDQSSLKEADRSSRELATLGIINQQLIINGIYQAVDRDDPVAMAFEKRSQRALDAIPVKLRSLPQVHMPFKPGGYSGLASLVNAFETYPSLVDGAIPSCEVEPTHDFSELIEEISQQGHGVIMTMGKGGVGKTTLAAAIALGLARIGHCVHLTTTDPAAHLDGILDEMPDNLELSRIDPAAETRNHIDHVMATAGAKLDAEGRELLMEELRSPCTEEIAVFQAFARTVAKGAGQFVVLDTAPTGHTLLLLDATEDYHREVLKSSGDLPEAVQELLPRLRDPEFTRILITTLPGGTPVHEAERLQDDLKRAGIEPYAWVVNQSFAAASVRDPLLLAQADYETGYIEQVTRHLSERSVVLPWLKEESSGTRFLDSLIHAGSTERQAA